MTEYQLDPNIRKDFLGILVNCMTLKLVKEFVFMFLSYLKDVEKIERSKAAHIVLEFLKDPNIISELSKNTKKIVQNNIEAIKNELTSN